jgi:hypothetical protein
MESTLLKLYSKYIGRDTVVEETQHGNQQEDILVHADHSIIGGGSSQRVWEYGGFASMVEGLRG